MLFRKKKDDAGNDDAPTVWLDDFLDAVKSAVVDANRVIRDQHIDALGDLYDVQGASGESGAPQDPTYVPKVVRILMPPSVLPGTGEAPPVAVPLPALAQNDALVLGEVNFDLDCRVQRYAAGPDGKPGRIAIDLRRDGAGSAARIALKYRMTDPPEAVARINDALLRTFS
jgi:hypothetical protein